MGVNTEIKQNITSGYKGYGLNVVSLQEKSLKEDNEPILTKEDIEGLKEESSENTEILEDFMPMGYPNKDTIKELKRKCN